MPWWRYRRGPRPVKPSSPPIVGSRVVTLPHCQRLTLRPVRRADNPTPRKISAGGRNALGGRPRPGDEGRVDEGPQQSGPSSEPVAAGRVVADERGSAEKASLTVTPLERPIRRPIRPHEVGAGIHIDRRLAPGATSVTEARAALRPLERAVDPNTFETLRLLVSEVVTNSVRHGTNESSDDIELSVDASRERIRVEVSDAGPGFNPAAREQDADQGSGWGLHLVELLSDRWGTGLNGRMRVWFELVDSGAWARAY